MINPDPAATDPLVLQFVPEATLKILQTRADELTLVLTFKPFSADDDGAVYQGYDSVAA